MDGMYCCSYARFAVRAGIVAAIVGVVLFAAASLAGAQTIGTETSQPGTHVIRGLADDGCLYAAADVAVTFTP
ncbi:MAG: hypothetical protein F4018_09625 [Acidobacteria bacterium]|nr:hypothetical protein [Acidobacteriota bacterium]MYH30808.1 hypothetical protein [Acidobacteriota bacterium]MYK88569.1 hypothetical protein [Acidobacteriota bacterium]